MAKCVKITFSTSQICIGDLRHRIQIISHTIEPPMLDNPEYTIDKSLIIERFAANNTIPNETVFDTANVEQTITDDFYIRYTPLVTAEHWIRFKGNFYNIVSTENIGRQELLLRMRCNIRGLEPSP